MQVAGRLIQAGWIFRLRQAYWFDFFSRLLANLRQDYVGLLAAGIAFYFLMAAFPALAALVSLYGIFSDPAFITAQVDRLSSFLPPESLDILLNQAKALVSAHEGTLNASFIISIALAIFSATRGMTALIQGFNVAYNEKEKRNIVILELTAFILTLIMMIYGLVSLTLVAGLPAMLHFIHTPETLSQIMIWLRWPILFATALLGLEILYYYGPSRSFRRWRWLSPGSVAATTLWVVMSALFSLFVSNFDRYNEVYGPLSAIVVLLLWFWLGALTILLGAEINTTLEKRHAAVPKDEEIPPLPKKP
jgi:membrane protein